MKVEIILTSLRERLENEVDQHGLRMVLMQLSNLCADKVNKSESLNSKQAWIYAGQALENSAESQSIKMVS